MRRFHANRNLAMLLFPLISVAMTWASPDPRLLSLVPPGAQLVAGMSIPIPRGRPDGFLLMSYKDLVDRRDFMSLVGVDDSLIIDQMLLVAGAGDTSKSGEHSLLMSGHFDQTRIFKAAVENGARVSEFRGIRVLVPSNQGDELVPRPTPGSIATTNPRPCLPSSAGEGLENTTELSKDTTLFIEV